MNEIEAYNEAIAIINAAMIETVKQRAIWDFLYRVREHLEAAHIAAFNRYFREA